MDLSSTPGPQRMAAAAGELSSAAAAAPASAVEAVVPDDATLMLRYRKGDVRAFEMLYERHKGALYRYLQRLCRSPEMANDLFQEVWSKVIASRERYEAARQVHHVPVSHRAQLRRGSVPSCRTAAGKTCAGRRCAGGRAGRAES